MSPKSISQAQQLAANLAAQQAAIEAHHYTDTNRGPMLLRVVWTLLALATVVTALRAYVKTKKANRLYWDDLVMLVALVLGYGHAICITLSVQYGLGRHMAFIQGEDRENCLKVGFASMGFGYMAPMAGRVSFCVTLLYLTATDPKMKAYNWTLYVVIFQQVAVNVIAVILLYSQCGNDLDVIWSVVKQASYPMVCWDPRIQTEYGYFQGSINTATDLYLTVIPALLIKHARLSLKSKLGLAVLLCLSVVAMIASIVKTYEAKALSAPTDYTYDLVLFVIWISIELNIVLVVSSVPLLRPLFQRQSKKVSDRFATYDISLGSVFSKRGTRSRITDMSNTSEEKLATPSSPSAGPENPFSIQVTHEVSITYQAHEAPFVHAALVGLVQGEIMKRKPPRPSSRLGA